MRAESTSFPRPNRLYEPLLIVASIASLVASCVLWSARKLAWADEVYSWQELRDPSLRHMLRAIQHGADGGMPLFYITGWLWCHTFGDHDLALRLYSCVCFCIALVVLWATLRRYYGVLPTAFGALVAWCTSGLLLSQNAEMRFYGLYVLTTCMVLAANLRLAEQTRASRGWLALAFFSQMALVLSHVLGITYGALILVGLLVVDRQRGRSLRWKVYLVQAAAWLSLLLWLPAIRASMAAGVPHGWIERPQFAPLVFYYEFGMLQQWMLLLTFWTGRVVVFRALYILCMVLLLKVFLGVLRKKPDFGLGRPSAFTENRRTLVVFAVCLLLQPLLLFLVSRLITPILANRYTLPSLIGAAILLATYAADRDRPNLRWTTRAIQGTAIVLLLITPVVSARVLNPFYRNSTPDLEIADLRGVPASEGPVVVSWAFDFLPLMRYSDPGDKRWAFLLDWPYSLQQNDYPGAVTDYHLMQAYRANGYLSDTIFPYQAFLCSHPKFLLLDNRTDSWFDARIKNVPDYQWRIVKTLDENRQLIEVTRIRPLAGCSQPQTDRAQLLPLPANAVLGVLDHDAFRR